MAEHIKHIVIVGAGFGGVKAASQLAAENVKITIIDKESFHLFQPLLYQIATAELAGQEICYPIRAFFRKNANVDFLNATVTGFDAEKKLVKTSEGDVAYDVLLLAAGATTNFFGMENVERLAYPMKTLQEALSLRDRILTMFERAERCEDAEERKRMLTFVIVGGGPTGVELAGALSELVNKVMIDDYRRINFREVEIVLVEAMGSLLPMMPEPLRDETAQVLRQRLSVDVRFNAQVMDYDGKVLRFKDGSEIPTETVIWAAGVKAVPVIATLGAETDRSGRVLVDEFLRVKGMRDIYAIGDCANFMQDERPLATIAPVATQQAAVCAENIIKTMNKNNEPLKEFRYKDVGAMAVISNGQAVMAKDTKIGTLQFTGLIAWAGWMVVHILRLAGSYTNIVVLWKWLLNFTIGLRLDRMILGNTAQPKKD